MTSYSVTIDAKRYKCYSSIITVSAENDLLISIDPGDPRPIYIQITTQVKEQIRRGDLKPGEGLPSVRELAENLGVNLHTVHHAYQQLREQGVINMRLGRGATVSQLRDIPAAREEIDSVIARRLGELITEAFHLGLSKDEFRLLVEELLQSGADRESKR